MRVIEHLRRLASRCNHTLFAIGCQARGGGNVAERVLCACACKGIHNQRSRPDVKARSATSVPAFVVMGTCSFFVKKQPGHTTCTPLHPHTNSAAVMSLMAGCLLATSTTSHLHDEL